uniref:Trimethylguanosine synthase n=1 Tax=Davidia involucrata TaxID=16924 RepID=A0A5B6YY02_DAVIN
MKKKVSIDFEVSVASRSRRSRKKKSRKLSKRRGEVKLKEKAKEEGVTPLVEKYWIQRYDLFSRYDEGIKMDEEGWFSATPEEIAVSHAERSGGGLVIDCFTGVGGNAIQFANMCFHVVAIDIDSKKVELAYNNAKIYGVENYIDFIVGDFFQLASSLKVFNVSNRSNYNTKHHYVLTSNHRLTPSGRTFLAVFPSSKC